MILNPTETYCFIVSFLRSGIEFIFSFVEENKEESTPIQIDLKSAEIVDVLEELDQNISRYWDSPADPFGADQGPFDLAGVPESHTWWGSFREK